MQSHILHISKCTVDQAILEEVLLTTYFMARYESVVQQGGDSADHIGSMKVWSHFDGVAAILRLWHDGLSRLTPSRIVKLARRTVIKSSLLREQHIPEWLKDGDRFGEHDAVSLEFDSLIIRVVGLRQECLQHEQGSNNGGPSGATAEHLDCAAHEIDMALRDWAQRLPHQWAYTEHTFEGVPSNEFNSPVVFSCARHGHAAIWTEYFSIQMLLMSVRMRALGTACVRQKPTSESLGFKYQSERLECDVQLNSASDSLASFLPFALGLVRLAGALNPSPQGPQATIEISHGPPQPYLANLVVWPLSIAASLQFLDMTRRQWFRSWLSRISSSSFECLVAYAMSDHWAVL